MHFILTDAFKLTGFLKRVMEHMKSKHYFEGFSKTLFQFSGISLVNKKTYLHVPVI